MRIVHISDIHLSEDNFSEFKNNYRPALLNELDREHKKRPINIIAITGDLVDKGGHSLLKMSQFSGETDPYKIFEKEFIVPIKNRLLLQKSNFVFIPGNHDIDEEEILWIHEKRFQDEEVSGKINSLLAKNKTVVSEYNHRIRKYKDFEKRFHHGNLNYEFSLNQSTYIYEYNKDVKIGFALINDSWRCSTCELAKHKDKKLYFGSEQLNEALEVLTQSDTTMNILLAHHPLNRYAEEDEIKRIIINKEYHLHLYGDQHRHHINDHISPTGHCISIMARAALNKPAEPTSKWQPGFHILDISLTEAAIECVTYYKYIFDRCRFGHDTDTAPPNGKDTTKRPLNFKSTIIDGGDILGDLDIDNYFRP